jgi:hypothetical protein
MKYVKPRIVAHANAFLRALFNGWVHIWWFDEHDMGEAAYNALGLF